MAYYLHYSGTDFELPNAKAAVELLRKIQSIKQRPVGGRIPIALKEPGAVVHIFIDPSTPIAISGKGDADLANEPEAIPPASS